MCLFKVVLPLLAVISLLLTTTVGCDRGEDFDSQVNAIAEPYQFHLFAWEVDALGVVVGDFFSGNEASDNNEFIFAYFKDIERIRSLQATINGADGTSAFDLASMQDELRSLREDTTEQAEEVVELLKTEIQESLSEAGIRNPFEKYTGWTFAFPPIAVVLENPPHLLVVSPRDRIENIKRVNLLQEMSREEMESIEVQVDSLGYSSLVVSLGGMATYPSFITNDASLRFTIDSIAHEWLHHYLAFAPLGFLYVLDRIGIRPDYDIATMNETVVNIVAKEIGAAVYEKYYPGASTIAPPPEPEIGFNFNRVMRETRLAVDAYLAAGEIDRAEQYMEEQRQFLAENGYNIRKLNQAYFAFYGAYADSPTSVSPIGADLKTLRDQSTSLKEFLDTTSGMTGRQDLEESLR